MPEKKNQTLISVSNQKKSHASAISYQFLGMSSAAIISFLLTPYILSQLGEYKYGAWGICNTMLVLSGMLDLGLRASIDLSFFRAFQTHNTRYIGRVYATARKLTQILSLISCAITALTVGVLLTTPIVPADLRLEASVVAVTFGLQTATMFISFPSATILFAKRKLDTLGKLLCLDIAMTAALTLLCVTITSNLGSLAIAVALPKLIHFYLIKKIAEREYTASETHVAHSRLRGIFLKNGSLVFATNSSNSVIQQVDTLTTLFICGIFSVTPYTLGATLASRLFQVQSTYRATLLAEMLELRSQKKMKELQQTLAQWTRLSLLFLLPLTIISISYSEEFFRLWLKANPELLKQEPHRIYSILATYVCLVTACGPSQLVIQAFERHAYTAKLSACEACINLTLSIVMGSLLGPYGIALATTVSGLLIHWPARTFMAATLTETSILALLKNATKRPLACSIAFAPALIATKTMIPVSGWGTLCMGGAILLITWIFLFLTMGLTVSQRSSLLKKCTIAMG